MTWQFDWNPARPQRAGAQPRVRLFFIHRVKELAYGGLFSTVFLLSQSPLHALVIDDIRVLSKLGQPLQAEVRVTTAAGERLTQACFSSVSGAGDLPAVGTVRLSLSRQLDGQILRVAGTQPMREPMSEFVLQVKCAGSPTLVRSFLVMVDPATLAADGRSSAAQQPMADGNRAATATGGDPTVTATAARSRRSAGPIEPGSRYLVRYGDMLSTIAARVAGRPDWSVWPIAQHIYAGNPGAFVMGDPNRIAQGSTIYVPRLDQVDYSVAREGISPRAATKPRSSPATAAAVAPAPASTNFTREQAPGAPAPAPAATPAPARIAKPTSARIAPTPQVLTIAETVLPAMQLTVALGDESRMKVRLRSNAAPVVDTVAMAPEPVTDTIGQSADPTPASQPEVPDTAATARVALPPQPSGTGWLGWLGIGAGMLVAFLLGAFVAGSALRRRLRRQYESQPEQATHSPERLTPVAASPVIPVAADVPEPGLAIDTPPPPPQPVDQPSDIIVEEPAHTVEVNSLPALDLELPYDEPAKVGAPETLEMPTGSLSIDLELPGAETGRTGQHEVDFELLEKAYSEDYESQFIAPHEEPRKAAAADDDADDETQTPGETAQYYHLENRDPADDTPLPIELGEDEMTGESDRDNGKIVNFPKSSSTG